MNLSITVEQPDKKVALFGSADRYLRQIRDSFHVQLINRDDEIRISGDSDGVSKAAAVLESLQRKLRRQDWLSTEDVGNAIRGAGEDLARPTDSSVKTGGIDTFAKRQMIRAKTEGQQRYLDAVAKHDLTFCVGPAGTGKTYLAVAAAAGLLKQGKAKRLILTRPAVEAGERLGFLPGDLQAKVNPYLRPLFDALHDMMDVEMVKRFMMNDVIEVVPLAFMRGRTLNESVIILDEAQNTTPSQMLMFLTRLGHESKMIVTGDATQIDLPGNVPSGLIDAVSKLRGLDEIAIVELAGEDIVRHKLVQRIVTAYSKPEDRDGPRPEARQEAGNDRAGDDEVGDDDADLARVDDRY